MKIRIWQNFVSRALLCTPNDRRFQNTSEWKFQITKKPSFLFSYFWCKTFSVSCRAPDPVRILPDPDPSWFSGSRTSMERLTQKTGLANYLEILFNGILKFFHRSGPRAPNPYPNPQPCRRRMKIENPLCILKQKV